MLRIAAFSLLNIKKMRVESFCGRARYSFVQLLCTAALTWKYLHSIRQMKALVQCKVSFVVLQRFLNCTQLHRFTANSWEIFHGTNRTIFKSSHLSIISTGLSRILSNLWLFISDILVIIQWRNICEADVCCQLVEDRNHYCKLVQ